MNKSPAFRFYPKDFLSDINVSIMSMEERGAYMTLLCYCWLEGWLPNGSTILQRLCNNPPNWDKTWERVKVCFYENGDRLYHKRLDIERNKQIEWRKKSQLGGIKSGETRRKRKGGSKVVKPKDEPMVEPNTNISFALPLSSSLSSSNKNTTETPNGLSVCLKLESSDDIRLTQLLIDLMTNNNPKSHILKSLTEKRQIEWIRSCRLMRERDNRTTQEIEAIVRFSQSDEFWKSNILSMPKLREKFDQLWLKAQKTNFSGIREWVREMEEKHGQKK